MEGVPKMAIVPAVIKKLMNGKDNSLYQFKQYLLHRRKK